MVVVGCLTPLISLYPLDNPGAMLRTDELDQRSEYILRDEAGTGIAELAGLRFRQDYVIPGSKLAVDVCWRSLNRTAQPYAVFVRLLDGATWGQSSPSIVGGRRSYPGLGAMSTDRWRHEARFCDLWYFPVSDNTATPGYVLVEIGMLDPSSGARLAAED